MPSASLAVAHRPSHGPHDQTHPDRVRIAALSAAIALNLAALLMVLRPVAPQFAASIKNTDEMVVNWITPKPKQPDPPQIEMKARPVPPPPAAHAQPKSLPPPVAVPTDEGTVVAPPAVPAPSVEPAQVVAPPVADPSPIEASLAYRTAPLTFPPQAIRRKMQGTVMLRVLVDAEGKPVQVVIETSSGYELLDKSARDQVLANWRFQPATSQGRPESAWARVPVSFDLRQL
ncbi:energy transducer TonB [Dyella sp. BiH032]|uniref:energy transducer TonB n=1 Tax=Dyella sp. BiH032 TaxID=3075430 RepID=UPI0028933B06|nr:energy transducer TonB [Dyella sp. BiH032]WNL45705.1 energy transducer TonB [Dyella sp. BiH032]